MNTATQEVTQSQSTAGRALRQLRVEKDLTIDEVASQLRLDPKIIKALEEDNYDRFPADTYIRGYLRSYAKLVGADGNEILLLYRSKSPDPPEIIPDVKHPTQVSSSDKPVKAFTYLVTFILVILLFIWWRQTNFLINQTPSAPQDQQIPETEMTTDKQPDLTIDTTAENSVVASIIQSTPELPDSEPTLTLEQSESIENYLPVIEKEELLGIVESSESSSETMPEEAAGTEDETDENKAMPGPDTIILKLNDDCWIEVHDRYSKEVYFDLGRTGEEISLNGFAPFQVKLGKAEVVIVEYNGMPVDTAPYTTRGIARFTLD